jgi:hypothetical protein
METDSLPTAENKPPKLRWHQPTPGRLLVVLLMVEVILLLSKPWLPKGYAVLIAIASVGVTMVLMLVWWLLALLFHWRFQFSLRSLMVVTVVVAIPFSWLAVEMKAARKQREVVELFRRLWRDSVVYDYQYGPTIALTPTGPVWLRTLLGDDFFANVFWVNLAGTKATDADLKHLEALPQLQWLWLRATEVTDGGLRHLQGLSQLQRLFLEDSKITDAGLLHLKGLIQLRQLYLDGTHVTDKGVKDLQQALPDCHIER